VYVTPDTAVESVIELAPAAGNRTRPRVSAGVERRITTWSVPSGTASHVHWMPPPTAVQSRCIVAPLCASVVAGASVAGATATAATVVGVGSAVVGGVVVRGIVVGGAVGGAVVGGTVGGVVVGGVVVGGVVVGGVVVGGVVTVAAIVIVADVATASVTAIESSGITMMTVVGALEMVDDVSSGATAWTVVGGTVVEGGGFVRWRTVTMAAAAAPAAVITPAMTPMAAPRVRRRRNASTVDGGAGTAWMSRERSRCSSRSTNPGSGSTD
jgi:hypothetical protein